MQPSFNSRPVIVNPLLFCTSDQHSQALYGWPKNDNSKSYNGFMQTETWPGSMTALYPSAPDVRGRTAVSGRRSRSVSPPEWSSASGSAFSPTPSLSPCQKCRYSLCQCVHAQMWQEEVDTRRFGQHMRARQMCPDKSCSSVIVYPSFRLKWKREFWVL